VRTRNGNGIAVAGHDLAEQGGTVHHRNAGRSRRHVFRIVAVNSCRIDDGIDIIRDILGALTVFDLRSHRGEMLCER